jgi:hypothetical protein
MSILAAADDEIILHYVTTFLLSDMDCIENENIKEDIQTHRHAEALTQQDKLVRFNSLNIRDTQTHRQHGDLINLLFFFQNKESRFKLGILELEYKWIQLALDCIH